MAVDVDRAAGGGPHEKRPACLPTKQRNALSKLFERPDFTPEEVHALGHARLLKVSGLGPRGLDIIAGWLAAHDLQLTSQQEASRLERQARRVDQAIRFLQRCGYEIRPPTSLARD